MSASPLYLFPPQVIFSELFQLPVPPRTEVMYTTLLIELCKLQPGSLPQVVSFLLKISLVPSWFVASRGKQTIVAIIVSLSFWVQEMTMLFWGWDGTHITKYLLEILLVVMIFIASSFASEDSFLSAMVAYFSDRPTLGLCCLSYALKSYLKPLLLF